MRKLSLPITYVVLIIFSVPVVAFTLQNILRIVHFNWDIPFLFTVLFCPLVILICSLVITRLSKGYYKIVGYLFAALIALWFLYFLWRANGNF